MEEIRRMAAISVARGCGFGALAVFTLAIALSYDPFLAARAAALLSTMGAAILLYRAQRAPDVDHRSTEVWVMIDKADRPPGVAAQRVIGGVLRDTYLHFARIVGATAAGLWLLSFGLGLLA
jgi:hypothetical protein